MHIQFERTGGFAGMRLATTIDSDSLSSDETSTLLRLVHSSSFFDLPPNTPKSSSKPDTFQYKLQVKLDNSEHAIEIDESAVPQSLRPLINWLVDKAKRR